MVDSHATVSRGPDMPNWGGSREPAQALEMPQSSPNRIRLQASCHEWSAPVDSFFYRSLPLTVVRARKTISLDQETLP